MYILEGFFKDYLSSMVTTASNFQLELIGLPTVYFESEFL